VTEPGPVLAQVPAQVLVVSGTGTGVGKTVVTAAIAALAAGQGRRRVAAVKPAQTGEPAGPTGDLQVIRRLSGVTRTRELARFPDPLSPEAAARAAGRPPLDLSAAAVLIKELQLEADLVLVEGAGGLLVRYDPAGGTIADLAAMLGAPVLVVTTAGLGTLNHTALTLEALHTRQLTTAGIVIGSWPTEPGLAERANRTDLPVIAGGPLAGALPADAARLSRAGFLAAAQAGLSPAFGGTFGDQN
jgi:dethiobiotin synthetase